MFHLPKAKAEGLCSHIAFFLQSPASLTGLMGVADEVTYLKGPHTAPGTLSPAPRTSPCWSPPPTLAAPCPSPVPGPLYFLNSECPGPRLCLWTSLCFHPLPRWSQRPQALPPWGSPKSSLPTDTSHRPTWASPLGFSEWKWHFTPFSPSTIWTNQQNSLPLLQFFHFHKRHLHFSKCSGQTSGVLSALIFLQHLVDRWIPKVLPSPPALPRLSRPTSHWLPCFHTGPSGQPCPTLPRVFGNTWGLWGLP